ncbi:hypothetical protein CCH79_00009521, partial [Gambusia affinis]
MLMAVGKKGSSVAVCITATNLDCVKIKLSLVEFGFAEQRRQFSVRSAAVKRKALRSSFPVLELPLLPIQRHVYEANLRNSRACQNKVSGCVDHFAWEEKEAFDQTRNIISTLNFHLPEEEEEDTAKRKAAEEPLHSSEELLGLAPRSYSHTLDVKMIVSRLTDGSRFLEFKGRYGTTLVTGFAKIHGHLVGIVANNGALTYEAALKGSHFVQLCDQRDVPLLFLQNTAPAAALTLSAAQAETNSNRLKAQGSMMSAVACASVPKITVVIGGCHGGDSYAMCGRAFDPNFLFLWPNARVSLAAPGHADSLLPADTKQEEEKKLNEKLEEESSAFFSSGRMWDDGVILPQETRKVLRDALDIIKQQRHQLSTEKKQSVLLRICSNTAL